MRKGLQATYDSFIKEIASENVQSSDLIIGFVSEFPPEEVSGFSGKAFIHNGVNILAGN